MQKKFGHGRLQLPVRPQRSCRQLYYAAPIVLLLVCFAGVLVFLVRYNSTQPAPVDPKAVPATIAVSVQEPKTAPVPSWEPIVRNTTLMRALGAKLDPEVFRHIPAQFDPGFKTPCWKSGNGSSLNCLPAFYVLGGFQCGSGALFAQLRKHPQIVAGGFSQWHFWGEWDKTAERYLAEMKPFLRHIEAAPGSALLADSSASTFAFYWSAGLRAHRAFQSVIVPCFNNCSAAHQRDKDRVSQCLKSQCYPAAQAADHKDAADLGLDYDFKHLPFIMRAAYGNTSPKFIVMLRDPVERLYSAYWFYAHYQSRYGSTSQGFLTYIREQIGELRNCIARGHTATQCALYFEALGPDEEQVFFHADQVIRGMYSVFVEIWLKAFPKENFLFIRTEEYFDNPEETLRTVFTFLGLPVPADAVMNTMLGLKYTKTKKPTGPVLPDARHFLQAFYAPFNEHLAQMLGDVYLLWNKQE